MHTQGAFHTKPEGKRRLCAVICTRIFAVSEMTHIWPPDLQNLSLRMLFLVFCTRFMRFERVSALQLSGLVAVQSNKIICFVLHTGQLVVFAVSGSGLTRFKY
jgi:hypothetical protein